MIENRTGKLAGVAVAALTTAALALLPAAAGAHGGIPAAAVPWVAQYTMEIASGSQNATWTEHHQGQFPCDPGETGSGSQDVMLAPHGTAPVFANGIGPILTSLMVAAPADIPNPGDPNSVPQMVVTARATVIRTGQLQAGNGPVDPTQCPSGDGGTGPIPQPDCGTKSELLSLWFSQETNRLVFEQPDGSVGGNPFNDCPFLGVGGYPTWQSTTVALPLSGWGPPPPIGSALAHGLPVHLQGEASAAQHDADIDATTSQQMTVRFVPLYVAPTIVLGDVANEKVAPDGTIGVPARCPAGEKGGCTGTVALSIDIAVSSAVQPGFQVVTVAGAQFKLKPGARQRIAIKIKHASKSYLRALAQTPLALIVTVGHGKHHIRYVAAKTRLRP